MASLNPLVRTAQSLFRHGIQHYINASDLDKMLTVIHSDNAIELLLKDKVKGFSSIHEKQIPSLLNDLRQDVLVSSLSGDIRLIHEIRNASYHLGISVDTYTLNYVIDTTRKLFNQCGLFPNAAMRA